MAHDPRHHGIYGPWRDDDRYRRRDGYGHPPRRKRWLEVLKDVLD